jgi:O-antigen/teichoic acid export membrane protein
LLALAAPIGDAFDAPRLAPILRVMAPMFVIGGMNWFYESLLQRELDFRARFYSQAARTAVYAAVAVTLAAFGAGVWSLVVGHLAMDVAYAISLLALAPYRVSPAYRPGVARDALGSGRGFVLQGTAEFLQQNADYLAVGRILGVSRLGAYSMAYRLAEIPSGAVAVQVASVTFPSFVRMRQAGQDVTRAFVTSLRAVALATVPLGALMSGAADPFVDAVFGPKWVQMIGPLAVMGVWAAIRPLMVTLGWLLNSLGEQRFLGRLQLAVLPPHIGALVAAASFGNLTWVAWAMVAHMASMALLMAWLVDRRAGVAARVQARAVWPVLAAAAACWLAARLITTSVGSWPAALALGLAVGGGLLSYVTVIRALDPGLLRDTTRRLAAVARRRNGSDRMTGPGSVEDHHVVEQPRR